MEIVGVVNDVPQLGLDSEPAPVVYSPVGQRVHSSMVVMVRTAGDPAAMENSVRRVLAATDGEIPIQSLKTMNEWLGGTLMLRIRDVYVAYPQGSVELTFSCDNADFDKQKIEFMLAVNSLRTYDKNITTNP